MQYYVIVLLVYFGIDLLAVWGLNLEFGVAGIANLGYILVVAAGAYAYAVVTLGPSSSNGGFQSYVVGAQVPPAVGLMIAAGAGAVVGTLMALPGLRRVRQDYQAIVALSLAILAVTIVGALPGLFNGDAGLSLIPSPVGFPESWDFVVLVAAICCGVFLVLRRFTAGPMGRTLRAMRDNGEAAVTLGKNVVRLRLVVQCVGGALGGLSGGLLAGFITAWSPSAWQFAESFLLLTAIVVGGAGSDIGALVGTAIIPVGLIQAVGFLPEIPGHPGLREYLSTIANSLLTIGFIFFRPRGLVPERRPTQRGRRRREPGSGRSRGSFKPTGSGIRAEAGSATRWATLIREGSPPESWEGTGASTEDILVVDELTRSFGGVHAVDGVSFRVRRGSITGLIGPNGAGKSTVIGLLSGHIRAQSGRIYLNGAPCTFDPPYILARKGVLRTFQLPHEFSRLTTLENVLVAAPAQRAESVFGVLLGSPYWKPQEQSLVGEAERLLAAFDMEGAGDQLAGSLSGGQKRLVEIMRVIMARPRLLLMDEPTAGLSPKLVDRLEQTLIQLRGAGVSVLLVEHELGVVERLCDQVIVMAEGRVLAEGAMAELRVRQEVQDAYLVG